jgi:hypothetical protein
MHSCDSKRPQAWLAAAASVAMLFLSSTALCAAAGRLQVDSPTDLSGAPVFTVTQPSFRTTFVLRNLDTTSELTVQVLPGAAYLQDGRLCGRRVDAPCGVVWRVLRAGHAPLELADDTAQQVTLPGAGQVELAVEATLRDLGTYTASVSITENANVRPLGVKIVRQRMSLAADAIDAVTPQPLNATYGTNQRVPFVVRNDNNHALKVDAPVLVRLTQIFAGPLQRTRTTSSIISCLPQIAPGVGTLEILAKGVANCELVLQQPLGAGSYEARVGVVGQTIERVEKVIAFSARAPGWVAFALLFAGAVLGGGISVWQTTGRRFVEQKLRLLALLEGLAKVEQQWHQAGGGREFALLLDKVRAELQRLDHALEQDAKADLVAALTVESTRMDLLPRLLRLEQDFSKVQQPTEALLSARSAALATLDSAVLQRPTANALLDTYAAVLAAERPRGLLSPQDVASPAPSWNLPPPVLVSTREALNYLRRGDNLLMTVTCILASLIGVATLWQPNPAWGSLSDWLVALLTGLGVGLGGTLTLQQLTANTALPTFPR